MFESLIINTLIAGIGVAIVAGVVGCFIVWRNMAYFGDSLAHSSLLGIALGLVFGVGANIGVMAICLTFALLLVFLQQRKILATDTILGILSHSALSIGMVVISLLEIKFHLHSYLFGDILTVMPSEILWIYVGGAFILSAIIINWSSLILMTISEDLAKSENIKTFAMQLLLMGVTAVFVAISIRVVGLLLITSMLIIPAASSRQIAKSPESMALISVILAIIAVIIGVFASFKFDTPSGPSIVSAASAIFIISLLYKIFSRK